MAAHRRCSVKWVSDGMKVYLRHKPGEHQYEEYTVTCATGDYAQITHASGTSMWVRVDWLIGQEEVAGDAARRLSGG